MTFNEVLNIIRALIAQLDRALDYGSKGWGFDSLWAHQLESKLAKNLQVFLCPKVAFWYHST